MRVEHIFWSIGPGVITANIQKQVVVVGKHGKSGDINMEHGGKTQHIVLNMLSAMFKATVCNGIKTAGNAVVEGSVVERYLLATKFILTLNLKTICR